MNARILGLTISNNLKWNDHMANIIKKANKPLYFIVQLKCTKVPEQDIITFYVTCVRPVLEYSCQVFHFALPAYLSDAIEWVQKHALAIIYPNIDYTDSLDLSGILKLSDRHLKAYDKLFNDIVTTPSHNLGHLQPERHIPRYNLRQTQVFVPPRAKTCRFMNTFIPSSVGIDQILIYKLWTIFSNKLRDIMPFFITHI